MARRPRETADRRARSDGSFRAAPGRIRALVAVTVLTALGVAVSDMLGSTPTWGLAARLLLLAALGVGFEEITRHARQLRARYGIAASNDWDMTSVWLLAAALALPAGWAAVVVVAIFADQWFRQRRPAGAYLYRTVYTASCAMLQCWAASLAFHAGAAYLRALDGVGLLLCTVTAMVVFALANRILITLALGLSGAPVADRLRLGRDDIVEFATLCLGGLAAPALLYVPALLPLVLLPMYLLQRAATVSDLEAAASLDSKTGLLNALTWESLSSERLARSIGSGGSAAVAIVDLDRFKLVNDIHGHLAGDHVLRAVATTVRTSVRASDIVGRFGGEEFVVLLPDLGQDDAAGLIERLRAQIHTIRLSDCIEGLDPSLDARLSASIGVAMSGEQGTVLAELLTAADAALYVAKRGGRNRVEFAAATA